jgi:hypothetical protein
MVTRPLQISRAEPWIEALPESLTLAEAAAALRVSEDVLYVAIRSKEPPAFIPRGRDSLRGGGSMGYRIHR